MNTPNKLTILRILLAFVCIGLIIKNSFLSVILAFIVFSLASITDFFDGFLARKNNLVSDLGKLLDPIADKILIIGVFCAFLQLGIINAWMVSVIMFREFVVTGLRFYGLSKGVILEARSLGKNKTLSQIIGAFIILIFLILAKIFPGSQIVYFFQQTLIPLLMWYIVIITLYSGVYYFWANRRSIRTF